MATADSRGQDGLRRLTERFPNQSPKLAQNVNLMFIQYTVLNELVLLLNIKDDIHGTKDYQGLGNHFVLDMVQVMNIERSQNPAKEVLLQGVIKGKSYLDLLMFLIEKEVDGQDLLLNSWPATLENFRNYHNQVQVPVQGHSTRQSQFRGHGEITSQGQIRGQVRGHGQVRGQVRGHGEITGQGQIRGQVRGHGEITREPEEGSWNCQASDQCSLSLNDLNYAESVFSNIDNEYPSSNMPAEIRTGFERTRNWVDTIRQSPRRSRTVQGQNRGQPGENTESFELNELGNNISHGHNSRRLNNQTEGHRNSTIAPRLNASRFNIQADIEISNVVSEIKPNIRVNIPYEDQETVDNEQTISKSIEADSRNPNIVEVTVHRVDSFSSNSLEDRLLPYNSQSDGLDSQGLSYNSQSDGLDSQGDPNNSQSDELNIQGLRGFHGNSQSDEFDIQGLRGFHGNSQSDDLHLNQSEYNFFPPSVISSSVISSSVIPPSVIPPSVIPQSDPDSIILGEESCMIPSIQDRRSVNVLLTSVGDEVTLNVVENLVQDLRRQNIGYVAELSDDLKVKPYPSPAEFELIQNHHKTWLRQKFEKSDCIIMVITENYLDYIQPKFNWRWRNILHRIRNKTNFHQKMQKYIYNMVVERFNRRKDGERKYLIPVLIRGSNPNHIPDWVSRQFFQYEYQRRQDFVYVESELHQFFKRQFL